MNIQPDGYVDIEKVLKEIPNCTINDIKRIVNNNDKQRFKIKETNDTLMIRANQGHTIPQVNLLGLIILTDIHFDIVHGTFFDRYLIIKKEGLSRMKRNHIHFSKGLNFKSGLRRNVEVLIYIDFYKAISHGLKFYESDNGVILSSGNTNGYIESRFFLKVTDLQGRLL